MNFSNLNYDVHAFAEIVDGTWGKSAQPVIGTSIKVEFIDAGAGVIVRAITTTKSDCLHRRDAMQTITAELDQIIQSWTKTVKQNYKEKVGSTLNIKLAKESDATIDIKPLGRSDQKCDYLVVRTVKFLLT